MPNPPHIRYLAEEVDETLCPHCNRYICDDYVELGLNASALDFEPEFDADGYAVNWQEVEGIEGAVVECESCNRLLLAACEKGCRPYIAACRSMTDLRYLASFGLVTAVTVNGETTYTTGKVEAATVAQTQAEGRSHG